MYSLPDIVVTLLTSQFPRGALNFVAPSNTVEGGWMRMECAEEEEERRRVGEGPHSIL